ncbi:MAG: CBS domain-containing protein [Acidobacteriota bacterium]
MKFEGEIFVSEILDNKVFDRTGEKAGRVFDLIIVPGELFPAIDSFILKSKGKLFLIPYGKINFFNRELVSVNLKKEEFHEFHPSDTEIFLKKDIFDKQIVDVNGAKLVRVNDVKVREINGKLSIIAVDVGFRGILRRLGLKGKGGKLWSRLVRDIAYDLINWSFIQTLEPKIDKLALSVPREKMSQLHPSDIAALLSQLPFEKQRALINSMEVEIAAKAIPELEPKLQISLIESLDRNKAIDILKEMPPDEAADLLKDLEEEEAGEMLMKMEKEEVEEMKELLKHEDDTAGGLMTTEFIALKPYVTVEEVHSFLRLTAADVENIYNLYVTDEKDHLLGYMSLRELFMHSPSTIILHIMNRKAKAVSPDADRKKVAQIMAKYNLLSLPVVDKEKRIIGIITFDDVLEFLIPVEIRKKKKFE